MNAKGLRSSSWSLIFLLGLAATGCDRSKTGLRPTTDGSSADRAPDAPIGNADPDGGGPVDPTPIEISSPLLDFGSLAVGETSLPQVVTVKVLVPTKLDTTVTGTGFALASTTCTAPQPVGRCTVAVTFTPIGIGATSGALTIGNVAVALSGVGVLGPPAVFTATETVDLGEVLINQAAPVAIRITPVSLVTGLQCMVSSAALSLTSQTCPASGTLSEACTLTFAFRATTVGKKRETVVCTAGGRTTQTLVTANVVTGANLVLDPPSVSVTAGIKQLDIATLILANSGISSSGQLIAAITAGTVDFSIVSNGCDGPLAPLETCTIQVGFSPTTLGSKTGTLTVTDRDSGQSAAATLLGTALDAYTLWISPSISDFGSVAVGASKAASFTVRHSSRSASDTLQIGGGSSEFIVDPQACKDVTLPPSGRCTFAVTFAPTSAGVKAAALILTTMGVATATAQVIGVGVQASISISATTLAFGAIMVGTQSGPRSVTVTNTGTVATGTLQVLADQPHLDGGTSPFTIQSKCNGTLAPGESCTIEVSYTPAVVASDSVILTVTDGTVSAPSFEATGTSLPLVTWAPLDCAGPGGTISFADTPVGGTSPEVICTLKAPKVDGGAFTFTAMATGDFAVTSFGCTETVCSMSVVFRPTARGTRNGMLRYNMAESLATLTAKGI